ncbi:DEAD/DEAH box helicase [bacterium]|nr:DEAD/DEAH box helicase [bacterium]
MITEEPLFHPLVADWFQRRYGHASPPQQQGWPAIAAGRHTLILAPTGSGKTLAAFLWCIDRLLHKSLGEEAQSFNAGVHTLYISPLKALNNDIHLNLQEPLLGLRAAAAERGVEPPPIRAAVRTGDTTAADRQKLLRKPPHILITTPESLSLLLTSLKGRELFRWLQYVIVDEIHSLCGNKRGVHLSLSLERLSRLCGRDPQRIGLSATQRPLSTVAAFLGGGIWNPAREEPMPRPVTIIDCGIAKKMNLSVLSPLLNFGDLPDASVWSAVVERLYLLIRSHRTTLIFVSIRSQAEKLTRRLNERHQQETGEAEAVIALAHHGSMSRDLRLEVEQRLKQGTVPAVVATASLELGIDIGSIDLVVQVGSPKSVAAGLQRVGRSGHLLHAGAQGCIIPLYPADLDDSMAATRAMLQAAIEETTIPENCLDVLAQHIVAEVSIEPQARAALYRLFRQSHCYRRLTEHAFNQTVEMLAGRFSDAPLAGLQPRLSWDRINDRLIGRRGSRLLAVLNSGTIPDRGYFTVVLAGERKKVGEVEEEFVFESKVGDHFFLGNSEWRIQKIDRNEIHVCPIQANLPRSPFWKGEPLFKNFSTCAAAGALRAEVLRQSDPITWLQQNCHCDAAAAENLYHYLQRQLKHTGCVPTDTTVVVEQFVDASTMPHLLVHAPFGSRVTGAWAMVLAAALTHRYRLEFQYTFDDDGMLFRFPDSAQPLDINGLFTLSLAEAEQWLLQGLAASPLFAVRFRQNAGRSLILPRSRPGKRIPLWLQRLRSADLQQTVQQYPEFPILAETYRDCLQDVFDWPALQHVLVKISAAEITLHFVRTHSPSPMASGLMFRFLAGHMYEYDRARIPDHAAAISNELLAEIMSREQPPALVTTGLVEEMEQRWLQQTPDTRARDSEELMQIIEQQGPLSSDELKLCSSQPPQAWLEQLHRSGRIFLDPQNRWSAAGAQAAQTPADRIHRFLSRRGPKTLAEIGQAIGLPDGTLRDSLAALTQDKKLFRGALLQDSPETTWCDPDRFAELYRRAVVRRRSFERPADSVRLFHALMQHKRRMSAAAWMGYYLPMKAWEQDMGLEAHADQAGLGPPQALERGEATAVAERQNETGRTLIAFWPVSRGALFLSREELNRRAAALSGNEKRVLRFLRENGACFPPVISDGVDLSMVQVFAALRGLAYKTLAGCDDYMSFLSLLEGESQTSDTRNPFHSTAQPFRPLRRYPTRSSVRLRVQQQGARWFPINSFGVLGREMSPARQAEEQARLLLQRYGLVVKEVHRRERGLLPWPMIFHQLKRLEWQGEIRRGCFAQGISGLQFALPEVLADLENPQPAEAELVMLATLDPLWTLPAVAEKQLWQRNGRPIEISRISGNHVCYANDRPAAVVEKFARHVQTTDYFSPQMAESLAEKLKGWLRLPEFFRPRKRIELWAIDDEPAAHHPLATVFITHGFEKEGDKLILWPSGV